MSLHGWPFGEKNLIAFQRLLVMYLLGHVCQVDHQTTTWREKTFIWFVRLLQRNRPQNVVKYSLENQTPLGLERIKWLLHPPCFHDFTMNKNTSSGRREERWSNDREQDQKGKSHSEMSSSCTCDSAPWGRVNKLGTRDGGADLIFAHRLPQISWSLCHLICFQT